MSDTAALWSSFSGALRAWLRSQTRDPELAEELLQETFLKVHAALPDLRDQQRVTPWLYRIARSTLTDHRRRARPQEPLREEPAAPEEEDRTADQVVAGWLPGILAELPEAYREPLWLSEIEGLRQVEVARRLSLSPSGARSRIQRGRHLLRERLLACCEVVREGGAVLDWQPRAGACACTEQSAPAEPWFSAARQPAIRGGSIITLL